MTHSSVGTARVLVTRGFTNLEPIQLVHDQTFQHLSYFTIVLHKLVLLKTTQEIVHVTTFGSVDQEHQGVTAAILTEQGL